jgi:hypothetical protein
MKTKSTKHGRPISAVEVANVTRQGFWLMIERSEYFLPFEYFPWFRDATISELTNVVLPGPHHLYWPDLDIDLAVESLTHPERYPLISSAARKPASKRARS